MCMCVSLCLCVGLRRGLLPLFQPGSTGRNCQSGRPHHSLMWSNRSLRSVAMNNSGKLTFRRRRLSAHLRSPKVPWFLPPCQACQPFLLPDGGYPPRHSHPRLHRSSLPPLRPAPPRRPPLQSFLPSLTQTPHAGSHSCPHIFSEPLRERERRPQWMKWECKQGLYFSLIIIVVGCFFAVFPVVQKQAMVLLTLNWSEVVCPQQATGWLTLLFLFEVAKHQIRIKILAFYCVYSFTSVTCFTFFPQLTHVCTVLSKFTRPPVTLIKKQECTYVLTTNFSKTVKKLYHFYHF